MSISSLVIHTRPEKTDLVQTELTRFPGVEVHAATDDGRLVVTVDQRDDSEASETFIKLQDVEGVISTSLVYSYFENNPADMERTDDRNQT